MKLISIKIIGACTLVALAIASSGASSAYASGATGSPPDNEMAVLTGQGISPARARLALDVQGKVAELDLLGKLQAAMGGAYAGAWFDNAAATLHVGAVSAQSARTAKAVAARAGLAGHVLTAPVRSTSAQLLAAQAAWTDKLAGPIGRNDASVGVEVDRNAVSVLLGSSVPPAQREALKRQASAAGVHVVVSIVSQLPITEALVKTECETFVTFKANCDLSLTPGVTIIGCFEKALSEVNAAFFKTLKECEENVGGGEGKFFRGICSAGPEGIPLANKEKTVVLTAGHCISKVGQNWFAKTKALVEKKIGSAGNFVFGGAAGEKNGDFAEIPIEAEWQTGKVNEPVFGVTAEWAQMNAKKEKTSYPVRGEKVPVVGMITCHVGQTSGESCGEITKINAAPNVEGRIVEGVVEVKSKAGEAVLIGRKGDSGGPELFRKANNEALMEGSLSAGNVVCAEVAKVEKGPQFYGTKAECEEGLSKEGTEGKWEAKFTLFYQALRQPEGKGKGPEGPLEAFKLDLLTTANEAREKDEGQEISKSTGALESEAKEVTLKAAANVVRCNAEKNTGLVTGKSTLSEVVITLTGCKSEFVGKKCPVNSKGALKEEIKTGILEGELGEVESTELTAVLLQPEKAAEGFTTLIANECTPETKLTGGVIGEVPAAETGKKVKSIKLVYKCEKESQALTEFETLTDKKIVENITLKAFGKGACETAEITNKIKAEEEFEVKAGL